MILHTSLSTVLNQTTRTPTPTIDHVEKDHTVDMSSFATVAKQLKASGMAKTLATGRWSKSQSKTQKVHSSYISRHFHAAGLISNLPR